MCVSPRVCAARQNFNVVRVFGFPVQKGFNLQTGPGVYNEWAFEGLDRVIAEAGNAGLRLIIALTNNWNYNTLQTDWKCAPEARAGFTPARMQGCRCLRMAQENSREGRPTCLHWLALHAQQPGTFLRRGLPSGVSSLMMTYRAWSAALHALDGMEGTCCAA